MYVPLATASTITIIYVIVKVHEYLEWHIKVTAWEKAS